MNKYSLENLERITLYRQADSTLPTTIVYKQMEEKIKKSEYLSGLILLNVGFSTHNADWNWRNVCSPFARIYYVEEGSAEIIIDSKTYTLKSNHLYFIPPFTMHTTRCDGHFSHYYTHFHEGNIDKESFFDLYDFPVEIEADHTDHVLIQKIQILNSDLYLRDYNPSNYDNESTLSKYSARGRRVPFAQRIASEGLLHCLLAKFINKATLKSNIQDGRVGKILRHIHANISSNISIKELANLVYLSEDHLIRIFKKGVGATPIQYINQKKIEKAQLLLLTSDLPIRDIAIGLSIDNVSYFNKLFRQYTRMTPSEYKEINNEED